jgi:hypothetical protein
LGQGKRAAGKQGDLEHRNTGFSLAHRYIPSQPVRSYDTGVSDARNGLHLSGVTTPIRTGQTARTLSGLIVFGPFLRVVRQEW